MDIPAELDNFTSRVRGWMRHDTLDVAAFLEALGRRGAIHHSALVMGATVDELRFFGDVMGLAVETV